MSACGCRWDFDGFEAQARAQLSNLFSRGNISVGLMLKQTESSGGYRINEEQLAALLAVSADLRAKLADAGPPSIEGLLGLRGVIEAVEDDVDEDARAALEKELQKSLSEAAAGLATARAEEGARLLRVLGEFVSSLDELCRQAQGAAEVQGDTIRARMQEQLADILAETSAIDPGRLEQEVALLMTKADIREELDRLAAHIASVQELLAAGGAIGRRLDFLCQELNREANTICSKATDTALTRVGLDMKATIEQFREQVQNIE